MPDYTAIFIEQADVITALVRNNRSGKIIQGVKAPKQKTGGVFGFIKILYPRAEEIIIRWGKRE